MKDFKVNEDSWHFKFNIKFLHKAYEVIKTKENAKTFLYTYENFCQYWRMTLKHLLACLVLATFASAFIFLVSMLLWAILSAFVAKPLIFLSYVFYFIIFLVAVFSLAAGIVLYVDHSTYAKRIRANGEVPEGFLDEITSKSILFTKIKSMKDKVCPRIVFVNKKE